MGADRDTAALCARDTRARVRPCDAGTHHRCTVAAPGFNWIAFATQFAIAASYNISYAPYVSDYSRYLPKNTRRAKLIAVIFAGASLSGTWMIGLGAWLAQKLPMRWSR